MNAFPAPMASSQSTAPSSGAPQRLVPLQAAAVCELHERLLAHPGWPQTEASAAVAGLAGAEGDGVAPDAVARDGWHWIETNHRFNARLWAEEDLARRTRVSDAEIAANKRAIDGFNQARNDATERVDEWLLTALGLVDPASARTDAPVSTVPAGARLNSETAGSMIDRLSILSLKLHAMHQQTQRSDVDAAHRISAQQKWERLRQQRQDLADCLDALLAAALAGEAYFKVYRQFKMYNDPRFNPALVAEAHAHPHR